MANSKVEMQNFRVDSLALLTEVCDYALTVGNFGVLKVPLNVFKNLLAQVAHRATQLHDPILDKIMFDMTLYELPAPTTPEYNKLMKQVYVAAEKQKEIEKKQANA
jgi:hypothetical protein